MTKDEALRTAIDVLKFNQANWQGKDAAIKACEEALEIKDKPVNWKHLYELEKKRKEAIYEKYERDIAKLPRIIPMEAKKQEQDEPVAWYYKIDATKGISFCRDNDLNKPWVE